jgi:CoA:oxalate CoA-transferase
MEREVKELVCAPILDVTDLPDDQQVLNNEYIVDVPGYPVEGSVKMVGFPVKFSQTPCQIQSPAPQWGEHTEKVLVDICGYSWDYIEKLKEEEII